VLNNTLSIVAQRIIGLFITPRRHAQFRAFKLQPGIALAYPSPQKRIQALIPTRMGTLIIEELMSRPSMTQSLTSIVITIRFIELTLIILLVLLFTLLERLLHITLQETLLEQLLRVVIPLLLLFTQLVKQLLRVVQLLPRLQLLLLQA